MRERHYRADLLLPGDITPHGVVADCIGESPDYVLVTFADGNQLRLARSEEVEVRRGA